MTEKRREPRDSVFLRAALRLPGETRPREVRVRNLSATGLLAEGAGRLAAGARVEVELRNLGWVRGTIAWAGENRCGVAFDQAVDARRVRQTAQDPTPEGFRVRRPLGVATDPVIAPDPARVRMI
ncbi:MAG: PilZ domain-containing protein [Sphingomonadales bacterium]|nr:PilZ domain-containing protein [Sphingomonadales bacterium]